MREQEYFTPEKRAESLFEDRRSSFLGHLCPVENEDEAKAFVTEMKKRYADARHNVWAYTLHDGTLRSSDDGEPAGTGGAPVLDAIVKRGLTDTVIVVTRYFGGILLGTGGLVHAYSAAASEALNAAGRARVVLYEKARVSCPYALYGKVNRLLEKYGAREICPVFLENVEVTALLPAERASGFSAELTEQSAGALTCALSGKTPVRLPVDE